MRCTVEVGARLFYGVGCGWYSSGADGARKLTMVQSDAGVEVQLYVRKKDGVKCEQRP